MSTAELLSNDFEQSILRETLLNEVVAGLSQPQKRMNPKFFYNELGSKLFDEICKQPEYYPTRVENVILQDYANDMAELLGQPDILIEYGSGTSQKVEILLDRLPELSAYVPIEISKETLLQSSERLRAKYTKLKVIPICADFTTGLELPLFHISKSTVKPAGKLLKRVAFFPGSTLGNFESQAAKRFLIDATDHVGWKGGLLVGIDLKKDPAILESAYNDAEGLTARFNLNLLTHLNLLFESDFDLNGFYHRAVYNKNFGRVEMHLVSNREQMVHLGGMELGFKKWETIHTESSYKYSLEDFYLLAEKSGFHPIKTWTDPEKLFSVHYLEVTE